MFFFNISTCFLPRCLTWPSTCDWSAFSVVFFKYLWIYPNTEVYTEMEIHPNPFLKPMIKDGLCHWGCLVLLLSVLSPAFVDLTLQRILTKKWYGQGTARESAWTPLGNGWHLLLEAKLMDKHSFCVLNSCTRTGNPTGRGLKYSDKVFLLILYTDIYLWKQRRSHLWENGGRSRGESTAAPEEESSAAWLGGPEKGEEMMHPLSPLHVCCNRFIL